MFSLTKFIVIISLSCIASFGTAVPHQELAPRPGYVPVYIREGNAPLSQINPKLAEAFHEEEEDIQREAVENIKNGSSESNEGDNYGRELQNMGQEKSYKISEKLDQNISVADNAERSVKMAI